MNNYELLRTWHQAARLAAAEKLHPFFACRYYIFGWT
jgi:hypothetical protein